MVPTLRIRRHVLRKNKCKTAKIAKNQSKTAKIAQMYLGPSIEEKVRGKYYF
jgi:hypothetical protein